MKKRIYFYVAVALILMEVVGIPLDYLSNSATARKIGFVLTLIPPIVVMIGLLIYLLYFLYNVDEL